MNDAVDRHHLVELLGRVSLLSRCTEYELTLVARRATTRRVAVGEHIVHAGELGTSMMLLLSGSAHAVSGGRVTRSFSTGEYFGELSALLPAPRTTDVIAATDCLLAVLDTNSLYTVVDTIPGVARKLLEAFAADMRERLNA